MVDFWHWHIPTFIITDISPPWWDFVMVGICWVTVIVIEMRIVMMIAMVMATVVVMMTSSIAVTLSSRTVRRRRGTPSWLAGSSLGRLETSWWGRREPRPRPRCPLTDSLVQYQGVVTNGCKCKWQRIKAPWFLFSFALSSVSWEKPTTSPKITNRCCHKYRDYPLV